MERNLFIKSLSKRINIFGIVLTAAAGYSAVSYLALLAFTAVYCIFGIIMCVAAGPIGLMLVVYALFFGVIGILFLAVAAWDLYCGIKLLKISKTIPNDTDAIVAGFMKLGMPITNVVINFLLGQSAIALFFLIYYLITRSFILDNAECIEPVPAAE